LPAGTFAYILNAHLGSKLQCFVELQTIVYKVEEKNHFSYRKRLPDKMFFLARPFLVVSPNT
jgi:hypothetical protein